MVGEKYVLYSKQKKNFDYYISNDIRNIVSFTCY